MVNDLWLCIQTGERSVFYPGILTETVNDVIPYIDAHFLKRQQLRQWQVFLLDQRRRIWQNT